MAFWGPLSFCFSGEFESGAKHGAPPLLESTLKKKKEKGNPIFDHTYSLLKRVKRQAQPPSAFNFFIYNAALIFFINFKIYIYRK